MASAPNPDFLGRVAITKATFASLAFKLPGESKVANYLTVMIAANGSTA
jgi:hypothetical protein